MDKCRKTNLKTNYIGVLGPRGLKGESDRITIRNTITGLPNTEAKVIETKENNNHILDFIIPKGEKGAPDSQKAYLVTFNNLKDDKGIEVLKNGIIPIDRIELDMENIMTINSDKSITFNKTGYYKISFMVSAYKLVNTQFNPKEDFISIGFKEINTDNIYIGGSKWVANQIAGQLVGAGIVAIDNINKKYVLENLSPSSIYLNSPSIDNISSASYFINPLVVLNIEYLGI